MLRPSLLLSLIVASAAVCAWPLAADAAEDSAATPSTATLTSDDSAFVLESLQCGLFEVKSSELALKRDPDGPEHAFAQQIVDDHAAVNKELADIAKARSVAVPTTLNEKLQKQYDELAKAPDKDFAASYIDSQVAAHKKAVSAFTTASEDAKDADVKAFATKHLPHLQTHLDQAKLLAKGK